MLVIKEMVLSVIGVYTVLSVIGQCATCLPLIKKKATLTRGCQRREVSYSLSPSAVGQSGRRAFVGGVGGGSCGSKTVGCVTLSLALCYHLWPSLHRERASAGIVAFHKSDSRL